MQGFVQIVKKLSLEMKKRKKQSNLHALYQHAMDKKSFYRLMLTQTLSKYVCMAESCALFADITTLS